MLVRSTFTVGRQHGIAFTHADGTVTKVYVSGGRNLTLEQTLPGQKKVFFSFHEDKGVFPFSLCYKFLLLNGIIPPRGKHRTIERLGNEHVDLMPVIWGLARNPFPYTFHTNKAYAPSRAHFVLLGKKPVLELHAHGLNLQISLDLAAELVKAIPVIQTQKKYRGVFRYTEAVWRDVVRKGQLDRNGKSRVEEVMMLPPSTKKQTPKKKQKVFYQHEAFTDFSKDAWPRGPPTKKVDLSMIGQPPKPMPKQKGLFPELGALPPERKPRRRK